MTAHDQTVVGAGLTAPDVAAPSGAPADGGQCGTAPVRDLDRTPIDAMTVAELRALAARTTTRAFSAATHDRNERVHAARRRLATLPR